MSGFEHKPPGKKKPSTTATPSTKRADGAQAHAYERSVQAMGYESGREALAPGGRARPAASSAGRRRSARARSAATYAHLARKREPP